MHGTMPPAGASHGDRGVFLAFLHEARQDKGKQGSDTVDEAGEVRIGLDIGRDCLIQARPGPQHGIVVRVAQEPRVEHHVGLAGQARRKREGHERHRHSRLLHAGRQAGTEAGLDPLAELGQGEVGGVDHQVGMLAERPGQLGLLRDPVEHTPARRQRVPSPGVGEAPEQHGFLRPGVNQLGPQLRVLAQRFEG